MHVGYVKVGFGCLTCFCSVVLMCLLICCLLLLLILCCFMDIVWLHSGVYLHHLRCVSVCCLCFLGLWVYCDLTTPSCLIVTYLDRFDYVSVLLFNLLRFMVFWITFTVCILHVCLCLRYWLLSEVVGFAIYLLLLL